MANLQFAFAYNTMFLSNPSTKENVPEAEMIRRLKKVAAAEEKYFRACLEIQ